MMNSALIKLSEQLAQVYKGACLAEVEALKPGNVHIFADGHDMVVQDFIQSAVVSSKTIAQPGLGLGERIFRSVDVTWRAVNCNTNLGIVLLCAPIVQAALLPTSTSFRGQLAQVLAETTQVDAVWLYKAIQLASPAGLGQVKMHDVNETPTCNLLEAMQASADRDFICQQYNNGFLNVLEEGLPQYQAALLRWERSAWATTGLYLYWLSHYPDSHIVRKYGQEMAAQVQKEALAHYSAFQAFDNPKHYLPQLLQYDRSLKERGVNPGTSADLTVASLLLQNFAEIGFI
jgi:triphosphoribosyl-dephospho-CoA synthase